MLGLGLGIMLMMFVGILVLVSSFMVRLVVCSWVVVGFYIMVFFMRVGVVGRLLVMVVKLNGVMV